MSQSQEVRQQIAALIENNHVILFMKGTREAPQCGFSARTVQILDDLLPEYETVDVLENPEIRDGIKEYSQWPTIPQLYIKGEFIGGSDIVGDLYASGELHKKLGMEAPERKVPNIEISDAAAQAIREHLQRNPGREVQLSIDRGFHTSLSLGPRQGSEIEVIANGIRVLMDPGTAGRAEGLKMDLESTRTGTALKVENPNAPAPVKQLSPAELKKMLDEGARFEFFDVRTPEERATASIAGTRLLDQETAKQLESLPKDTALVFHCHHGGRSQQAAEHFRARGFSNVYNLAGGIDAWSIEVDPDVPRY